MPRPPLIHFPGASFHITARGNNKREIFFENSDFKRYLDNIEICQKKLPFKLYSFVLMPNHLHLFVEVNKFPINKIMQVLQTGYAMYFNKKYDQIGHLFQGRYHFLLVDKETYLLELIRYINLNPVRAEIVENPIDYPWCSHQAFLNPKHPFNKLLDRDYILSYFSQDTKKQIKEYEDFIVAGIGRSWKETFPETRWNQAVGSDEFLSKIERKIRKKALSRRL